MSLDFSYIIMRIDNNTKAFLALLGAGLWERDIQLLQLAPIDYKIIYRLAKEQAVIGLVAAGLEHITDIKVPQEIALMFVGETLQLEIKNKEMNAFISELIERMRKADIYAILVKGQGIAQCYERPLWRSCGDVDLLLSTENYKKAVSFLSSLANNVVDDISETKHYAMTIGQWVVELHGTLHTCISPRVDSGVDFVQNEVFYHGNVRTWNNGNTQVFLPGVNQDVVFVFAHILQHFFLGGIGLRQLCDLSRFLWTYKKDIDEDILLKQLSSMGLMSEWKAFACVLVDYLEMDNDIIPFYDKTYSFKAKRILSYLLKVGNFGHNKDNSYQSRDLVIIRKMKTFFYQAGDSLYIMRIFPRNAIASLINYWVNGTKEIINSE